jgi:hypothetical protein
MINEVISILVMDKIFKEVDIKLSFGSMQFYQNCLNHHFASKEEELVNLNEFYISYDKLKNLEKYKLQLTQLEEAKLIVLEKDNILFLNVWSKHLQLYRFKNNIHKLTSVMEYQENMYNSHSLVEAVAMKNRIKKEEVNQLLQLFFSEQNGIGKEYQNESECRKHFIYWSNNNINKVVKVKVKSKSQILGLNNGK